MQSYQPHTISIAGYDPSGGAGVLADVKTFENIGVAACAVSTCLTFQNDAEFDGLVWHEDEAIGRQFTTLARRFPFTHAKIGLVRDLQQLVFIVRLLKNHNPDILIVFDPIMKASAGYDFGRQGILSESILRELFLVTPNRSETRIFGGNNAEEGCRAASAFTNILLTDGESDSTFARDILFTSDGMEELVSERITGAAKHGSGCVLSSAVTAYLSLGHDLMSSCRMAKEYTLRFLTSTDGLLGMHQGIEVAEEAHA